MSDSTPRCPGQDGRSLTAEDVACPVCGYPIEFFSDEHSRKCPQCGGRVGRVPANNCQDWCSAASKCALLRGIPGRDDSDEDKATGS